MAETAMTELEAVNIMLDCIGEAPVSSLEVTGLADLEKARACLNEISRQVQDKGYHFNSETDYPLLRDVDGHIKLAMNMIRVDTTDKFYNYDVTQRGLDLYWKDEHTFVFDQDLEGDVVFFLAWDQLPQAARQYIAIKAARIYQARQLGSDTKHKFSQQQELEAHTNMVSHEIDSSDVNMFNGSWSVANILDR